MPSAAIHWPKIFQSTLPVRGATVTVPLVARFFTISIHAPREGSDHFQSLCGGAGVISIHAPRERSDYLGLHLCLPTQNFNPRSP